MYYKFLGPLWYLYLNIYFQFLNHIIYIFTYFFIHIYFLKKNKLHYYNNIAKWA